MPDRWIHDHVGNERQPREGFEEELADTLHAAWRGEPAGRMIAARPRRRPGWTGWSVIGLSGAAAIVLAVALVVWARDSDSGTPAGPAVTVGSTAPSTSRTSPPPTPPPTTGAPTSAPATAPTLAPTTIPAVAPQTNPPTTGPGFQPACSESVRTGSSTATLDEPSLDTFGPLQAQPAITIDLPASVSPEEGAIDSPTVTPARIPGGLLLAIKSSTYGYFDGAMLAAVDADGATRWVRCFSPTISEVLVAPASAGPTTALIHLSAFDGEFPTAAGWEVVSLADGSSRGPLDDRLAEQGFDPQTYLAGAYPLFAASDDTIVFGPNDGDVLDVSRDRLLWVDLKTYAARETPMPDSLDGTQAFVSNLEFTDDGILVLRSSTAGEPLISAVYLDGGWTTDPGARLAASPPTVGFGDLSGDRGVRGIDAMGQVLWHEPSITAHNHEGFLTGVSDDVTVVSGCHAPDDGRCASPVLAGIRTADGEVLWQLDGGRGVGTLGDGYAIITEGSTWTMIDTDTGQPIDGQTFSDPEAFGAECCGGGDFHHVRRSGGVVVAVNYRTVSIWYPQSVDLTPTTLSIP